MSIPLARSRYKGEFVVSDIQNNKKYLADLIWSWSKGLPLTDFALGGTTVPTIAADGQIDLYEATNLNDQPSWLYATIPNTLGKQALILHAKITKQNDDTSLNVVAFAIQIGPVASGSPSYGMTYYVSPAVPRSVWNWVNALSTGSSINITFTPVTGVEHDINLIMTDKEIIVIIDGVKWGSILINISGTAVLSATQVKDWNVANKTIGLWARHNAGQVSHYRVHDIKVGRLVGVSQ